MRAVGGVVFKEPSSKALDVQSSTGGFLFVPDRNK